MAAENLAAAQELAGKIDGAQVVLKVKTGEAGRLFGSVSSKEVADAIKDQLGYDVDKKKVILSGPIKAIGETTVPVKLHTKVTANIRVLVESL